MEAVFSGLGGREILPLLLTQPSVWASSSGPSKRVDEEGGCGLCGQSPPAAGGPQGCDFSGQVLEGPQARNARAVSA